METLTMFSVQGTLLIGKREGDKAKDPRRVLLMPHPTIPDAVSIGMQVLPGSPAFVVVKNYGFYYPVKDKDIIAVYIQSTSGLVVPSDKSIHVVN